MTRRMATGLAAVLAASLTVAGCGGGGGGDGEVDARPAAATSGAPEAVRTGAGADDSTIRVGLLADLSGPFAVIVRDIVEAQRVYWDRVNKTGGIAGRQVELLVEDTRYDVAVHRQRFEAMRGDGPSGVLIISQSTGSPHTAAISQDLKAEHMIAIPLSFYSALPDPGFGRPRGRLRRGGAGHPAVGHQPQP